MGKAGNSVVCLVALALCGCTQAAPKPAANPDPPQAAGLCRSELPAGEAAKAADAAAVQIVTQEMQTRRIPGLQLAVMKQGEIVLLQSCGIASVEFGQPVRRDTRFQIASATKPFTGVAIMQLVEAGKLKLDAPVADYLDGLPEAWRKVTVRQALMHVSGLPDVVNPATGKRLDPASFEATLAKAKTEPMQFEPGTSYRYNQTNYFLLGQIIDKLSGMPFQQFIRKQFGVAGAQGAVFSDGGEVVPQRASFYTFFDMSGAQPRLGETLRNQVTEYPQELRTAAGLTMTAEEIARWIIALNRGDLISPAMRDEMWTTGRMPDGKPTQWALGWPAISRAEHPVVMGNGGNAAVFYVYPRDDISVVVLTNLSGARPDLFVEKIATLYGPDGPK